MSLSILSKRFVSARHAVHDQRGFSLLSTLLAVMILAVILSIAVPRFTSAITTANTVKVQADLTALDTAIVLYQTAKGQNPASINDLTDYVTDVKNLRPPSGNVRVGEQEISMEGKTYQIEKKGDVIRATCDGKTAEEFHAKKQGGT
mgnify:FL=1